MSVSRWLDGKIFLPYKSTENLVSIRSSLCGKHNAMVYWYKREGYQAGCHIAIVDEYYPDDTYLLAHEAKAALDDILIRNGAKLLTCEEDADKYRILL